MDIRTVFILLIIGHVLITILSFGYFGTDRRKSMRIPFYAQVLFTTAYVGLYFQGTLPRDLTNTVSNNILMAAMILQMIAVLRELDAWTDTVRKFFIAYLCGSVLLLTGYIILENNLSRRIVLMTLIGIGIIAYPTFRLLSDRTGSFFRKVLGGTYVVALIVYIARILMEFGLNAGISVLDSETGNLLTGLSFYSLMLINGVGLLFLVKENADRELVQAATRDYLTGILNRAALVPECERLIRFGGRKDMPVTLLILDIDHFKQINDRYGHARGDAVLVKLADTLGGNLRTYDLFGRLGGEEFVAALPDTGREAGFLAAERLRTEAEKLDIDGIRVTVSIGSYSAVPAPEDDFNVFYRRADEALYLAKNEGRNRTRVGTREEG